jgi:hypothetical protein
MEIVTHVRHLVQVKAALTVTATHVQVQIVQIAQRVHMATATHVRHRVQVLIGRVVRILIPGIVQKLVKIVVHQVLQLVRVNVVTVRAMIVPRAIAVVVAMIEVVADLRNAVVVQIAREVGSLMIAKNVRVAG